MFIADLLDIDLTKEHYNPNRQLSRFVLMISYLAKRWTYGYSSRRVLSPGGGGGTPIWNRRGCSSESLNLTRKGDHPGVAQAFCDS